MQSERTFVLQTAASCPVGQGKGRFRSQWRAAKAAWREAPRTGRTALKAATKSKSNPNLLMQKHKVWRREEKSNLRQMASMDHVSPSDIVKIDLVSLTESFVQDGHVAT